METVVKDLDSFNEVSATFARSLEPRDEGATLVTLSGELGAGKTAFTKAVAKTLGVTEVVNSPTFVIEKMYPLPPRAPFRKLIHIDAYRLNDAQELAPLRLEEYLRDRGNLILLEWPERVEGGLPEPTHSVSFALESSGTRIIRITP